MDKKIKNNNYSAWKPAKLDFTKINHENPAIIASKLLCFAVLAPSSHNSQPWKFEIDNNTGDVLFLPDFTRRLLASDIFDRELYISLGAAASYYNIALKKAGRNSIVEIKQKNQETCILVRMGELSSVSEETENLFQALTERVTNRSPFIESDKLKDMTKYLKTFSFNEGTLHIIENSSLIVECGEIAIQAGISAMKSRSFREELKKYVKHNLTRSEIGMPAFGMDIPLLVSFIASYIIKYFNMNKITKKKDLALFKKSTPYLFIVTTKMDTPFDWITTGMTVATVMLKATSYGLSVHPFAGPIEIEDYHLKMESLLKTNQRLQFFCRIGVPTRQTLHSPRILAEKITKIV